MEREQIIKALKCCTRGRKSKDDRPCLECPYNECNIVGGTSERQTSGTCQGWLMKDALALIKQQDEQIFQLENRLKECENGYSQTLGIEWARIKELTEECENYKRIAEYQQNCNMDRGFKIKRLTEENERLKAEVSVKKKLLDKCVDLEDRVKDDTVKRFAEKLEITLMSRLVTATKEQKAAILFCINQINQTKAIMTKPKDCLQCKHFVGCEPSTLGGCDLYEEEEKK